VFLLLKKEWDTRVGVKSFSAPRADFTGTLCADWLAN
jgi:hypothetical protein